MRLLYYALVVLFCTTACTHKDDKEKILAHADEIEKQVLRKILRHHSVVR